VVLRAVCGESGKEKDEIHSRGVAARPSNSSEYLGKRSSHLNERTAPGWCSSDREKGETPLDVPGGMGTTGQTEEMNCCLTFERELDPIFREGGG